MGSTRLYFSKAWDGDLTARLPLYVLNRTEWRGKEPRSCAVTNVWGRPSDTSPTMNVEVTYKPKGFISYTGNTRYDGWTAMLLDQARDGTLLDGNGQPLKDDAKPVYLSKELYDDTDFDQLDFGEFLEEKEVPGIPRTTEDAVFAEARDSGKFYASVKSDFMAPRRHRPQKTIILSNDPPWERSDGFGGRVVNVNIQSKHFEHVLMTTLTNLMCEYLEGKVSLPNTGNDDVAFVDLSKSLVDCEGNEFGAESLFDVLRSYTPTTFLENLAKRIESNYEVRVAIIEGKGLVFRHDRKEDKQG